MSYADLYMTKSPMIMSDDGPDPAATVFGVPFDATHSYRPGCRFGPDAIRGAFNNIEVFHPDLGVDLETVPIRDLGNLRHTAVPSQMMDMLQKMTPELIRDGGQIFMLGGEHSVTAGTYPCFPKDTGYVVFDAHYDLRDSFDDSELSHASYLRRIIERRGPEDILHVGARAFAREELEFLRDNNVRTVADSDIRGGRGYDLLSDFVSSYNSVYVSYDLDVLDPAFAPGVGNPEAAGITSRELFEMMRAFLKCRVAGVDIVELNPYHDNGATAVLAAKIVSVMIAMNLSGTRP